MNDFTLRPRYKMHLPQSLSQANHHLQKSLQAQSDLHLRRVQGHIILRFRPNKRHFWSPEMDLNLEAAEGEGTTLRILIGPAAAVWTFYIFLYALAALVLFGGFILSYAQYVLDKSLWGFYLIPASVLMALLIFAAGMLGKHRASAQVQFLQKTVEHALQPLIKQSN